MPQLNSVHTNEKPCMEVGTYTADIRRSVYGCFNQESYQTLNFFRCHTVRVGHDNDYRIRQVGEQSIFIFCVK